MRTWAQLSGYIKTLDEPAGSALAEYRCAKDRLEVCCSFFFAGYWQAIAASAAAAGGRGRRAECRRRRGSCSTGCRGGD